MRLSLQAPPPRFFPSLKPNLDVLASESPAAGDFDAGQFTCLSQPIDGETIKAQVPRHILNRPELVPHDRSHSTVCFDLLSTEICPVFRIPSYVEDAGVENLGDEETALTLTSWNQLIADLTSIQAVMEHVEEKPSGQLVLAAS